MKNLQKTISSVLLVCFCVCLLAGCTGGTSRPPKAPENNNAATQQTATLSIADPGKVYDGTAVSNPAYETNSDGKATFTYYTKGSNVAIAAPVNAGNYTVKVSISETANYKAVSATRDFTVQKAVAVYSVPETLRAFSGDKLKNIDLSVYGLAWEQPETVVVENGTYTAKIGLDENNYVVDKSLRFEIFVKFATQAVEKPTLNKSFENDGQPHSVSTADIVGFDSATMEIVTAKSQLSATAVGTYTVTVRLLSSDCCWADNTDGEITLTWKIGSYSVVCTKGTEGCCQVVQNDNGEMTLKFSDNGNDKTVYQISGEINGNLKIDVGNTYKFELELCGVTITSAKSAPIVVLSGDKVTLTAKSGFQNYVYDNRPASDADDYSACVYSAVDLALGGKGSLTVQSQNNNGIHTKDDLSVKNLTLNVTCQDNALKGNDSVTVESGTLTLIAKTGDGIKTSNSAKKYESDGTTLKKIQGDVTISGGTVEIYAACDGIDAAHDVVVLGGSVSVYTDKYSPYSQEVTAVSGGTYYIRCTTDTYNYSVKYTDASGSEVWKNATYYQRQSAGGRPGSNSYYYYYKVEKPSGCTNLEVYAYTSSQTQGQGISYYSKSTMQAVNNSYDTLSLSVGSSKISISWTNYTTQTRPGGPGGMNDGNSDKGDHSTKGFKAGNEINVSDGTIFIKSYDDAIHTNNDVVLGGDTSASQYRGTGNVNVSGGSITVYSNDDGIHADGKLTVSGGVVAVANSYEGLEGTTIDVSGGAISVVSKDDGFNATATSGYGITISGGEIYVCAGGDGLDVNSKTSYQGIWFAGGKTVVINTSGGNSPLDTEAGYKYTAGTVVAIGPSNSMWNESIKCNSSSGFSSVGCYKSNVSSATYVVVNGVATVRMPSSFSAVVIVLGAGTSNSIISSSAYSSDSFNDNGVCWKV